MTALAAVWSWDGEDPVRRCRRMLDAQAIYGRDLPAVRRLGGAALGRKLHPLTPEDDLDRGPVVGGDGALLLVADARIDNRDALAAALGLSPGEVARLSDPELLLRVVERWGAAGVARVVGPFAFLWWNERTQALTLARDFMGERPLHLHRADGFVAVASMPKGLHALREVPYAPDAAGMADFLAILPETGCGSGFAAIERVRPGHLLEIKRGGLVETRYWSPPERTLPCSPADAEQGLREHLGRAVVRRLRVAGGRVGAQLSGGLDSAAVVATAAPLLAPERLPAFTAVPCSTIGAPPGTIADEGSLAAAVAAAHPTVDHILVRSTGQSPLDGLDRQFQLFERPVHNLSNLVWVAAINDAARARGVTVLLTGQMGNMTISHDGLPWLAQLVRGGRWVAAARLAVRLARQGRSPLSLAAQAVGPWLPRPWWRGLMAATGRLRADAGRYGLRPEALADPALAARAAARGYDAGHQPWADGRAMRAWALARVDLGAYHKGMLGGWGIDLRDPTADRDLVEFSLSLSDALFIPDGRPRGLTRRAFADRIPAAVLAERRRGFQAADWPVGLMAARDAVRAELDALDRCAPAQALIDVEGLRATVDSWPDRDWARPEVIERHHLALTRALAAGHFVRRVTRSN